MDRGRPATGSIGAPGPAAPGDEVVGGAGVPGRATGFSCPDCGGVLGEVLESGEVVLRCRVGHVLELDALVRAKAAAVEDALWASVRALEEKAALARRLFERAKRQEDTAGAERHRREWHAAERRAEVVRDVLHGPPEGRTS